MVVTQTILEAMENNMLERYGYVFRITITAGVRGYWPGRREGRKMKWEREMKQKNLTPEEAANRKIWRNAIEKH
jgi:hypothetical protein